MSEYSIIDLRINGMKFYAVEKRNKISFYTSNIAAARYWIRAEENDPTLVKPFHHLNAASTPTETPSGSINEEASGQPSELVTETEEPGMVPASPVEDQSESLSQSDPEAPVKPTRIS